MEAEGEVRRPAIVIGTVAPLGVSIEAVFDALSEALSMVDCRTEEVRLSVLLDGLRHPDWEEIPKELPEDERITRYMARGTQMRRATGAADSMALLAVSRIAAGRIEAEARGDCVAYLVRSLKRREEVDTLRRVYGDRFLLVGAHAPREKRVLSLARRIAESRHSQRHGDFLGEAQTLIDIDENEEAVPEGQRVRAAFPLADVFVNVADGERLRADARRTVELFFGNVLLTPTKDEHGMYLAWAGALRSADLSRQVGAAIACESGSIIAIGANEVPMFGGGAYWADSPTDHRDHTLGEDPNARRRRRMLGEVLDRLRGRGLLGGALAGLTGEKLVQTAVDIALGDSAILDISEYQRVVHAEMLALTDAARRGVATQNTTLYATTFPCHNCAKHVVAAGIRRVVFVEPYPKSLVAELLEDSIAMEVPATDKVLFEPFIGVAPRKYFDWFSMTSRKTGDGKLRRWTPAQAAPRVLADAGAVAAIRAREVEVLLRLEGLLEDNGFTFSERGGQA